MKTSLLKTNFSLLLLIAATSFTVQAQWTGSSSTSNTDLAMRMGKVGIGLASPATPQNELHIKAISSTNADIVMETAAGSQWVVSAFDNSFAITNISNSIQYMTIQSVTGNIGIGTGTAVLSQKLEVSGNIAAEGLALSRTGTQRGTIWFSTAGDDNHKLYNNKYNLDNLGAFNGIKWNVYDGLQVNVGNAGATNAFSINSTGQVGIGITSAKNELHIKAINSGNADVIFETSNSKQWSLAGRDNSYALLNWTSPSTYVEPVTVLTNGNVGIGNTAPQSLLDVNGQIKGGSLYMTGNVAIGVVNPGYQFIVRSSGGASALLNESSSSGFSSLDLHPNNANHHYHIYNGNDNRMYIARGNYGSLANIMTFNELNNVGIGTSAINDNYKLTVEGNIRARSIDVNASSWSDFVFKKNYKLATLTEVEAHIKEKGHLKDVPSAEEVEKNGIKLAEMDATLLRKIEELTLYVIAQQKEIETLKTQVEK